VIDYGDPVFPAEMVLRLRPEDLDEYYAAAPDCEKANPFFALLASYHRYLEAGDRERAAHLCFLMAYYLFTPLTPPGSWELAMAYIRQAVALNPLKEYQAWAALMEAGN